MVNGRTGLMRRATKALCALLLIKGIVATLSYLRLANRETLAMSTALLNVDKHSHRSVSSEDDDHEGAVHTEPAAVRTLKAELNHTTTTTVEQHGHKDLQQILHPPGQQPVHAFATYDAFPSLWIRVEDYVEGMANWRISFAELLIAARAMKATLVEPCIKQGRLCSSGCSLEKRVRLRDVFDMEQMGLYYPHIASEEEYQRMVSEKQPTVVNTCMHFGTPSVSAACLVLPSEFNGTVQNFHGATRNDDLEAALQMKSPVVVKIRSYRKHALASTEINGDKLMPDGTPNHVLGRYFRYSRDHYDTVDWMLSQLGITKGAPFDVIHWRAEVPKLNHDECASKILDAKKTLSKQSNDSTPTILISSINKVSFLEWKSTSMVSRRQSTQALKRLGDSGMLKLDMVSNRTISDLVMLGVWDSILGEKARQFSTCIRECEEAPCASCNYGGHFGQVVVDARKKLGKSSDKCWGQDFVRLGRLKETMEIPEHFLESAKSDPDLARRIRRIRKWERLGQHKVANTMITKMKVAARKAK